MAKSKTNFSEIKIADGIPVLSFAPPADAPAKLVRENFVIPMPDGEQLDFSAYYDPSHRLIFVLDATLDERTPNALLIINPDPDNPDRKWNDMLTRDYGADIESIRPKENNKYQKLDIEYEGLWVYNNVINAHTSGADIASPLAELSQFRDRVARRNATVRLRAAEQKIAAADKAIARAKAATDKAKSETKALREKLAQIRKSIGKEPTKESAAKILKTESRIDANAEKLKQLEKRERRAGTRLATARADAAAARARLKLGELEPPFAEAMGGKTKTAATAARRVKPLPEIKIEPPKKIEEQKVETMADENVKPLFDKDPDIMNEDFAFKPISFDMPSAQNAASAAEFVPPEQPAPQPAPTTFVPPAPVQIPETVTSEYIPNNVQPVISQPPEFVQQAANPVYDQPLAAPQQPVAAPVYATPPSRPMPPSGSGGEISIGKPERRRPSGVYYLLLIILIILSIFTLWLYQRKSGETVPNITAQHAAAPAAEQPTESAPPANPFISTEPVEAEPQPSLVESLKEKLTPIVAEPEQPENDDYLFRPPYAQTVQEPTFQPMTEEEILARKPAYDVSGPETGQMATDQYYYENDTYDFGYEPEYYYDENGVLIQQEEGYEEGYDYAEDAVAPQMTENAAAPQQQDNRLYYEGQYYEPETYNEDAYISEEYFNHEEYSEE